jgi:hypothetical protein
MIKCVIDSPIEEDIFIVEDDIVDVFVGVDVEGAEELV